MLQSQERINNDLQQHQINALDWEFRPVMESLHVWAERFVMEFKLQTTSPAISIERQPSGRPGHFLPGRNGFGLRNEIVIDKRYVQESEFWRVLGILLHELLHAEQASVGKPGRRGWHNKAYRERAASLGLLIDPHNTTQQCAPAPTPFRSILSKYGIEVPEIPIEVVRTGNSKLKPWICSCTPRPIHIQVAVHNLQARCLKCGQLFIKKHAIAASQVD